MDERIFDEAEKEARRARWWRRGGIVWGIGALGVVVGLVVWVFVDKHYRDRCGAHQIIALWEVRAISKLAHYYLDNDMPLPPTILAYFDDPNWDTSNGLRTTRKPCGRFDADEIRLGRYSMADVLARRVRQADIVQEAIDTIGDKDTWESYRTMGFLRDERGWTHGGYLVVFWMHYQHDYGRDGIHLCFAGDWAEYVPLRDLKGYLDASDAIAAEIGIDPAPAELRAWCK